MRKLALIAFSRELLSIAQMEVVFWTFHVQSSDSTLVLGQLIRNASGAMTTSPLVGVSALVFHTKGPEPQFQHMGNAAM
jgi:hypothetical protein